MRKIFLPIITLVVGLTILAGYFFQAALSPILALLIDWGVLLVGAAGLIGIGYLVRMHFSRLFQQVSGSFYSLVVLITFFFTLGLGLLLTPVDSQFRTLILNVQIPVETSLLAILAVTLMVSSLRLIRARGWTLMSIAFLFSVIFSLVLNLGYYQIHTESHFANLIAFFQRLPLVGMRGILMGMALGGLVFGLRTLLSIDRPYGE